MANAVISKSHNPLILLDRLNDLVVGQTKLIEKILVALYGNGHLILEGAPGLGKTYTVKCLANLISAEFKRIQFTPDLLPSDITGSEIYKPETSQYEFVRGPVFSNIVLADEINRAPAKVQAALLEAMGEYQVTISQTTHDLPSLFLVLATQNPLEHEGTYDLPEAQLDRFMLSEVLSYPDQKSELSILEISAKKPEIEPIVSIEQILEARSEITFVTCDDRIKLYITEIIAATRGTCEDKELNKYISFGAGPRATIALLHASKVLAYIRNQPSVTPDIVQELAFSVLRHRLVLSYEAANSNIDKNEVIERILASIKYLGD